MNVVQRILASKALYDKCNYILYYYVELIVTADFQSSLCNRSYLEGFAICRHKKT